jgi:cytochrome c-type biogenesis protein
MTLLPEISNPYLASFAFGLLYGSTFCTSTCLPYVTSYIAGIGAGFRKGVLVTSIYNSGRVTACALIGALTGIFKLFVSDAFLLAYQKYALFAFGAVTIVIGISILRKNRSSSCVCNVEGGKNLGLKKLTERFDVRAFSMGLTRGLIVCPPLIAILLYSITFSVPISSFILAILFGLGTALSPFLLLGGVTGWLLNKAPLFSRWISKIGAGILLLLGLEMLLNAMIH